MYGYESWTVKKAECRRIDAFKLWCWRRLLRVPWTARRSNQSILKEISPEYSLEFWSWNSNTLAPWCIKLTLLKRPWCWERLKVGGEGDNRGWDGWMASQTRRTWVWVSSGSWWWTGRPGVLHFMGSQRVGHDWVTELNRTELPHAPLSVLLCFASAERLICIDSNSGFPCPPTSDWVWSVGAWKEMRRFRSGFLGIYFKAGKTLSLQFPWLGFYYLERIMM